MDNRDVTSIRSNALQLRLAYVRLDYAATDKMDLFFEGGQDWAIFSSTVLPNLFETTFLGAFYGTIYDRSPQFRFGTTYKISEWRNLKISPEIALMMPSTGQIEKLGSLRLAGQIGQAEREGADSGSPELESRVVLQFQLDKAPGVQSAELFWAGFYSHRKSIVTTSNYATPVPEARVPSTSHLVFASFMSPLSRMDLLPPASSTAIRLAFNYLLAGPLWWAAHTSEATSASSWAAKSIRMPLT